MRGCGGSVDNISKAEEKYLDNFTHISEFIYFDFLGTMLDPLNAGKVKRGRQMSSLTSVETFNVGSTRR